MSMFATFSNRMSVYCCSCSCRINKPDVYWTMVPSTLCS